MLKQKIKLINMKKIYLFSLASLLGFGSVEAQTSFTTSTKVGKLPLTNVEKKIYPEANRAVQTFYVDYEYADQTRQDFEMGVSDWWRYIWDMNMNYPASSTSFRYGVVDFYDGTVNQINDSYGLTDGSAYPLDVDYTGALTIDSIFINAGHQNLSGIDDTLQVKVIQLNTSGYPTSTVLHTEQLIQNSSFVGGATWFNAGVIGFAPAFNVPAGTRFGIKIEYHGNTADTFGVIAGFGNNGAACGETPTLPWFAVASMYTVNSYVLDIANETAGTLPTSTGAGFYYPCNGVAGYQAGGDSEFTVQNWAVWLKVTANVSGVGIENNTNLITSLGQNMPNPFNANTTINYNLAASVPVTFTVTDLAGKVVMSQNYGKVLSGPQTIELSANQLESGIYYYTLTAGASTQTRKMVVAK
jgi:Secretion system C-terminal sorting domain